MRIGIDAMVMNLETGGISKYTYEMIRHISSLDESKKHEFIIYPGKSTSRIKLPPNWRYSDRRIISKGLVRSLLYPAIAKIDRLDLFYSATYIGPVPPMPCKCVVTVHDVVAKIFPELSRLKHRMIEQFLIPLSLKNSSKIIAVSNSTKNDILSYINIPENKVEVIYEGKDTNFSPGYINNEKISNIKERYGIGDAPYFLYIGDSCPRKNLGNLIRAYYKMDEKNSILVLTGNIKRKRPGLKEIIDESPLNKKIIFTGFADEEDLPYLYANARAFCFPSFYEGFGLPVLEAMACGCPVITSNISSLPEVAGDAAILVDPDDVNQISVAMTRLLTDDELCDNMREKGLKQAEKFSWEKAAKELLKLFDEI